MAKYWVTFVCSIGLMLSGCGDDEKNCVPAGEASGSTAGAQTGGVKAGAGADAPNPMLEIDSPMSKNKILIVFIISLSK